MGSERAGWLPRMHRIAIVQSNICSRQREYNKQGQLNVHSHTPNVIFRSNDFPLKRTTLNGQVYYSQ